MDTLADHRAIQDVMLRYAAGIDDRNRQMYRDCFAENAEFHGFGTQVYRGLDDWMGYVWTTLEKFSSSQHLLSPALIALDGDQAHARSDVQALHCFAAGDSKTYLLWATYETDLIRQPVGWKIIRHRLVVRGSKLD